MYPTDASERKQFIFNALIKKESVSPIKFGKTTFYRHLNLNKER